MNSHKERKERKKCRDAGDCVFEARVSRSPWRDSGVLLHQQGSGTVAVTSLSFVFFEFFSGYSLRDLLRLFSSRLNRDHHA
jgi:hypothetical protein